MPKRDGDFYLLVLVIRNEELEKRRVVQQMVWWLSADLSWVENGCAVQYS